MYFIDLNKLKIEKDYHYQTYSIRVELNPDMSAATILASLKEQLINLFAEKPALAVVYQIEMAVSEEIDVETFLSLVNLTNTAFFSLFITNEGRKRERRLDVPDNLKLAHVNLGPLKKAINAATVTDRFNVEINCGELSYLMADTNKNDEGEKINA